MLRPGITVLCAAIVLIGAALHGRATQRWESLVAIASKIDSLHDVVISYSDYESTEIPSEMPIKEKSRVTCHLFSSPRLSDTVIVSLTTGIPGSVSTHTPDVCYVGSGYRMTRTPTKQTLDLPGGKMATYYVAEFEKKRATGIDRQRVRWTWTADGVWDAPNSPRFHYLRTSELAKVYFVTAMPETTTGDSTVDSLSVRALMAHALANYSDSLAR